MGTTLDTVRGLSDTKPVTQVSVNTHCIVCGGLFAVSRVGKLYCSPRCKQFGFNHREKISHVLAGENRGISPTPITFYLEDYTTYNDTQRLLKRYKELDRKIRSWESISQEIVIKQRYGLIPSDSLWEQFASRKLTENEEMELYEAETNLEENLLALSLKQLSIEQWSFFRTLHRNLDDDSFYCLIASISPEFMQQLNFGIDKVAVKPEYSIIKNKYVNHCNLIASGVIRFEKKGGD